jgi:peroxiredoxin
LQIRARNEDATLVGTVTITPKLGEANEAVITLEPAEPCSIVGTLVDEAGKPIAGAKVLCLRLLESGQLRVGSEGVSGADGRFAVKGLEAEAQLFLDFQAGGYGQATPKPFSLSRGETHDAGTITLPTTDQEVAGKVVDLDGKPVAHASVKGLALASGASSYTEADSDGTFHLKNLPKDTVRINALLDQPPPGSATIPRTAATARAGTMDVQLVLPFRQTSPGPTAASVGLPAPELVLEQGTDAKLAQFKGKPAVLAFVNIYSKPCVKVLDDLKALQEKQGADKLGVIAVHDWTAKPEEIEQFRKDHSIPFPIVRVPDAPRDGWDSATFRAYGVTALPTVVRIDADGKVGSVGAGVR